MQAAGFAHNFLAHLDQAEAGPVLANDWSTSPGRPTSSIHRLVQRLLVASPATRLRFAQISAAPAPCMLRSKFCVICLGLGGSVESVRPWFQNGQPVISWDWRCESTDQYWELTSAI